MIEFDPDAPRAHVERVLPPWRTEPWTECGKAVTDGRPTISRAELAQRLAQLGKTRTAMITCMVCMEHSQDQRPWEEDPAVWLHREIGGRFPRSGPPVDLLRKEMYAMAALVAAHPEEWADLMAGLDETGDLAARREARRRVAARPTRIYT